MSLPTVKNDSGHEMFCDAFLRTLTSNFAAIMSISYRKLTGRLSCLAILAGVAAQPFPDSIELPPGDYEVVRVSRK